MYRIIPSNFKLISSTTNHFVLPSWYFPPSDFINSKTIESNDVNHELTKCKTLRWFTWQQLFGNSMRIPTFLSCFKCNFYSNVYGNTKMVTMVIRLFENFWKYFTNGFSCFSVISRCGCLRAPFWFFIGIHFS